MADGIFAVTNTKSQVIHYHLTSSKANCEIASVGEDLRKRYDAKGEATPMFTTDRCCKGVSVNMWMCRKQYVHVTCTSRACSSVIHDSTAYCSITSFLSALSYPLSLQRYSIHVAMNTTSGYNTIWVPTPLHIISSLHRYSLRSTALLSVFLYLSFSFLFSSSVCPLSLFLLSISLFVCRTNSGFARASPMLLC